MDKLTSKWTSTQRGAWTQQFSKTLKLDGFFFFFYPTMSVNFEDIRPFHNNMLSLHHSIIRYMYSTFVCLSHIEIEISQVWTIAC